VELQVFNYQLQITRLQIFPDIPRNNRLDHVAFGIESDHIGDTAGSYQASFTGYTEPLSRVACCQLDCLLEFPSRKTHHVTHSAVEREHAAR